MGRTPLFHTIKVKGLPKAKSAPEELFALQLRAEGIAFTREVRVCAGRRWRLDFAIVEAPSALTRQRGPLAVEIDGWGRHQRFKGFEEDRVKDALALITGWCVLHVTPAQVKNGLALGWVKQLI